MSDAAAVTGGCLCGAVRYAASAAPTKTSYCHCRACQRHFGAAAGMYTNFPSADFRFVKGKPKRYRSSTFAERGFCAACGSSLTFQYLGRPEVIGVAVGSLDHPENVRPEVHWGTESRLPWFEVDDDLPRRRTEDDPDFVALASQGRK